MDLEALKRLPRSRSLPQVYPLKLKLIQSDSIQSNGSIFGMGKDSGIVDENHSGISVGVMPEGLGEDFASQGSGMLASEPQSEVDIQPEDVPEGCQKVESEKSSLKLVMLNPFDKKMKELRTLKQHYYPEGDWGYVVLLCAFLVQVSESGVPDYRKDL